MNKNIFIIIILGIWWFKFYVPKTQAPVIYSPPPAQQPSVADDTAAAISRDLENITVSYIDSEFQNIDSDINSL